MRIRSVLVAVVGATSLLGALGPGALAAGPAAPPPADAPAAPAVATAVPPAAPALLDRPLPGAAAVEAVGGRLAEAAARNDMSPAELTGSLREDPTMWLGRSGRLHVKDHSLPTTTAPVTAAPAPFPTASTFKLHSRPGSSRVLHLDFDGHLLAGTEWNSGYGLPETRQPAFDLNRSPGTWSQAEHDLVQSVYLRVAEDFAPFDVDVTTQDPGPAALTRSSPTDAAFGMRVLITPSQDSEELLCPSLDGCGGVAAVGAFDDDDPAVQAGPAWVFPQRLANDPKSIAESASHEAGHTLGLGHHGTAVSDYYHGHNGWAPIMGAGYGQPLVQWSRGEHPGASTVQDDIAVMRSSGLRLRADDHGSTPATARQLGTALTASGVLETRTDKDVFAVARSCTGPLVVRVTPAAVSPNADLRVRLLSAAGAVLDQDDPRRARTGRDAATGLGAVVSAPTTPGTYSVEVDGVGAGDLSTGSSDYGSLGAYTVRVEGCPTATTRTVTLTAVADTQAREAARTAVSGAATSLASDGQETAGRASRTTAYVRFAVPALAVGESVSAAALSLQVTNATGDGPAVWRTAPGWSESAVSWGSGQPARSGTAAVGDFGAMAVGRVRTAVSGVSGGGQVSFQLHAEVADAVLFASREHATAASRPQLVLTVTRPATRTVTLTAVADTQAREAARTAVSGAATSLASDGQETAGTASRTTAYVRFAVPALAAGESVSAAALSLQVTNATGDGPAVWRTAPGWSESAVSWGSGQPARSGTAAVGDFGAMAVGRVRTAVSGVSGGGQVSFQLHAEVADAVLFASREHATATARPQLVLTLVRR